MRRRVFLATATANAIALAGCPSTNDADRTGTPTEKTGPTTSTTPEPTTTQPSEAPLGFDRIVANPTGPDDENLTAELVQLELERDVPAFDLDGFTLSYEPAGRQYEFTAFAGGDLVAGTDVRVYSGSGDPDEIADFPPAFELYVGSSQPLLSNEGGSLALANRSDEVFARLSYPSLSAGETYVVGRSPTTTTASPGTSTEP